MNRSSINRIVFASLASVVAVALVGSDCFAADAKQEALKANIVKFAQSKLGTKVGERGECTDLVDEAFRLLGAQPSFHRNTFISVDGKPSQVPSYGWGVRVAPLYSKAPTKPFIPPVGSIVQFEKVVIVTSKGTQNIPHHTVIVESVNGTLVNVLHQNSGGIRLVQRKTYDFAGLQKGGGYTVWYPLPK